MVTSPLSKENPIVVLEIEGGKVNSWYDNVDSSTCITVLEIDYDKCKEDHNYALQKLMAWEMRQDMISDQDDYEAVRIRLANYV